jgi:hypothetical protein
MDAILHVHAEEVAGAGQAHKKELGKMGRDRISGGRREPRGSPAREGWWAVDPLHLSRRPTCSVPRDGGGRRRPMRSMLHSGGVRGGRRTIRLAGVHASPGSLGLGQFVFSRVGWESRKVAYGGTNGRRGV